MTEKASALLFHLAGLDLHLVQDRRLEHLQIVLFQFILRARFTSRWVKGAAESLNDKQGIRGGDSRLSDDGFLIYYIIL